jgi:predicted nuclease of predicted toxin-antitoxin system
LKLLIDEMWSAAVAVQLRKRGHDVQAIDERRDLRSKSDQIVFEVAQLEHRTLVTENVPDFRRISTRFAAAGGTHYGMVYTRVPRHKPRAIGRLVTALDELLNRDPPMENTEYWLS